MAVSFHTQDTDYRLPDKRKTARWMLDCVSGEGLTAGDLTVVLCSDGYLLEMNRQFLGHDYFTDVITFDYGVVNTAAGDVFISVDTVAENALKYGVAPLTEMRRVIIHGVLHLCGYGDKTPPEEKIMRSKEDYYLALFPE